MPRVSGYYKNIEILRRRYLPLAKGKESLLNLIAEAEVSEHVYNSNAIESSTLSLDETEKILLKIDLDRYISERELFEAKNLAAVVEYINKKSVLEQLTTAQILFFHRTLLSNINDDMTGRFRKDGEWVRVADHIAADPKHVPSKMEDMLTRFQLDLNEHIVKRIARLHLTFENIHPFVDGNGRIGRVVNNYLLIRHGYVPINIKFVDRAKYYDAFREFNTRSATGIMEDIVGKALANSFHKRLAYLEGREILTLSDYASRFRLSHSNLLNKAGRQTIEAFLEKGIWKIAVR